MPDAPPGEPTLAELFNIPVEAVLEYEGKAYPKRAPTQVEQGLFSAWLEADALAFVERQTHLPPAVMEAHRQGVRADANKGKFKFYAPASVVRMNELDGTAKLWSITLLADGHAECTPEFVLGMILHQAERLAVVALEKETQNDPKARAGLDLIRTLLATSTGSSGTTSTA
jgi:hypothetical protein